MLEIGREAGGVSKAKECGCVNVKALKCVNG